MMFDKYGILLKPFTNIKPARLLKITPRSRWLVYEFGL